MRKPLLAANWKMNKTVGEAVGWLGEFLPQTQGSQDRLETVVCAPFTVLWAMSRELAAPPEGAGLGLGSQDIFWEKAGAYTGEISGDMLKEAGVSYVICGHSERRTILQEGSSMVSKKCGAALAAGMTPILCVGESEGIRESGLTQEWLEAQLFESLEFWDNRQELVIAYEPIWAIGTGKAASAQDAEEACACIRQALRERAGELADRIRILYGGSVSAGNIREFMACENVDGALVGGASLKAESFGELLRAML